MTTDEKIIDVIDDIIYRTTSVYYNSMVGNKSLKAANVICGVLFISDIDMICDLAKCIDENTNYDYTINPVAIRDKCDQLLLKNRNNKITRLMNYKYDH